MLVPGMVERCQPADNWFDRGYVGAFPRVAAKARESQIGFDRKPAVFPADDVIDLMRGEGVVLAQEAILATIEGAPPTKRRRASPMSLGKIDMPAGASPGHHRQMFQFEKVVEFLSFLG